MKNPWLKIPASDYEAHMALPEVAQTQALNKLMASALDEYAPESVAVIGCTTGNGLEHINTAFTHRVFCVDINSDYLKILKARYADKNICLELIEADVNTPNFSIAPVSMVFALLLFEYVDVMNALVNITRCMAPGGMLLVVLQLPSPESAPVTATKYKSLELLTPIMKLVDPSDFSDMCCSAGLQQVKADTIPLKRGKAFFAGFYRKLKES